MKKNRLSFYAMGAALALTAASCTNDMPVEEVYDGPVETSYLTVNIVASRENGTRAADNGTYENGLAEENYVNKVRFYFFNAEGNSANVSNATGTLSNYYDWTPTSEERGEETVTPNPGDKGSQNIEKVLSATIIINTAQGDGLPASVVAVVNPPASLNNVTVGNITQLNGITSSYDASDNNFVMTNSVYADGGTVMEAVNVQNYIKNSRDEALQTPATIYVERVNAKARMNTTLTEVTLQDNSTAYATGKINGQNNPTGTEEVGLENQIYVKFLGWNVTATSDISFLMKHIDTSWTNENVFGTVDIDWNSPTRYRSFWAINPSGVTPVYGNFNGNNGESSAQAITKFSASSASDVNYTYMQENAAPFASPLLGPVQPTQVIIAARLCGYDGQPLTVCEYASQQLTLEGLKNLYIQNCNVYRVIPGDGTTEYEKIGLSEITFKTATVMGEANQETPGRYYVYAQIDPMKVPGTTDEYYEYCIGKAEGTVGNAASTAAANLSLKSLGHAKIWNGGDTYYYFDIRHLGISNTTEEGEPGALETVTTYSPGYWGVVRNHIYDATIKTLEGLGTPVYDPDEVIYPEKPQGSDLYIGAEINILTWRVVASEVNLAW